MPGSLRSPFVGLAAVLTAASLFGMLGPLSRFAYDIGMQPVAFVAWRAAIACLATAIFVGWRVARRAERLTRLSSLDRRARVSLGVAAVMGFTLNLCMFIAFDRITVALALLGFYTYPVMIAVANVALGREQLDRARVVALALAVTGMVAVVASQLDPAAGIRFDAIGVALTLGAAASQATFVMVSRHGYESVPADQATTLILAVSAACCVALALLTGALGTFVYPFEAPAVVPIVTFTGVFAAAIPSMLFLVGIRLLGGTSAGILMLFEPVVAVVLAAWLLAEGIAPIQVVGGMAILAAAVILQRAATPQDPVVTAAALEPEPG
jgi:drug/metabolite transporter (DMT)-like permease